MYGSQESPTGFHGPVSPPTSVAPKSMNLSPLNMGSIAHAALGWRPSSGRTMARRAPKTIIVFLATALTATICVHARELSFAERVAAQEAIERVHYSHQIGATRPFEDAVPHEFLEAKVRNQLKQSAALASVWNVQVSSAMLQTELLRISRSTRLPDRLRELYQALDMDPVLIQECLIRPALVDRLSREFLSSDSLVQATPRADAERLHAALLGGDVDPFASEPHRWVAISSNPAASTGKPSRLRQRLDPEHGTDDPLDLHLSEKEFSKWRSLAPARQGTIGPVTDDGQLFIIRVVLSETPSATTIATYAFQKVSWDDWWAIHRNEFDESSVETVAADVVPLSVSSNSTPECKPADTWDRGALADVPEARTGHSVVWTGSLMIVWGGAAPYEMNSGGRYDPAIDAWSPTTTVNAPIPRVKHSAVWTGGEMIVWGGQVADYRLSEVYRSGARYDPVRDSWAPTSMVNAPTERSLHTAVWTGHEMIVWGGFERDATFELEHGSGGRYDPSTDTWQPISLVNAPRWRGYHTAIWSGTEMIVWGGETQSPTWPYQMLELDSGGRYDPVSDSWRPIGLDSNSPVGRIHHTAVWTGRTMIVWGGQNGRALLSSGGRYDPVSDSWSPTSVPGAPSPRRLHTIVWTGTEMIVWGGTQTINEGYPPDSIFLGSNVATGARYDPQSDHWMAVTGLGAPVKRSGHSAVWTGEVMIVWGGAGGEGEYPQGPLPFSSGGRYNPSTDAWTPTSPTFSLEARAHHSSIWTGSVMIVWGGLGYYGNQIGTGGQYDPVLDNWSYTSSMNAPTPRSYHSAVWTGDRMLVWGGLTDRFTVLQSGAAYDPILDTWTSTSISGAPAARMSHTAIWTGTEMIVWGGRPQFYYVVTDTGGRYDPRTNTWMATSMTNAPSRRTDHTAVWTGSRMIIWGGDDGAFEIRDPGGQYDPTTDSWTPVSRTNSPEPRYRHTALWSGTRMLVWGGYGNGPYNTGGLYDPLTDTWTPTSTTNAPTPLGTHTAVWTGSEMIVWGGDLQNDHEIPRGRYSAESNTWHTMSSTNAPLREGWHSAVWTGELMLVWGGYAPDGTLLNNGGRYAPEATGQLLGADAGDEQVAECSGQAGTLVSLSGSGSACDSTATLSYTWVGPFTEGGGVVHGKNTQVTLPLGISTVTLRVEDGLGHAAEDQVVVTVRDTTPPQICVGISPSMLWPPNHRMVDVTAPVLASDACSQPTVRLDSITSSEVDDAAGSSDGTTSADIQGADPGTADFTFQLRAERDGGGPGRIYRVTYSAVDTAGNRSTASALVLVPHDQGGVTEPVLLTARDQSPGTTFSWNTVAGAQRYEVIRGEVKGLKELGNLIDLGSVSCIYPSGNRLAAERTDNNVPPLGSAYFYLVSYNDGVESGWGTDTAWKPRMMTSEPCHAPDTSRDPNPITSTIDGRASP
jgi:N-acetylneuraminic acid mutarotase